MITDAANDNSDEPLLLKSSIEPEKLSNGVTSSNAVSLLKGHDTEVSNYFNLDNLHFSNKILRGVCLFLESSTAYNISYRVRFIRLYCKNCATSRI